MADIVTTREGISNIANTRFRDMTDTTYAEVIDVGDRAARLAGRISIWDTTLTAANASIGLPDVGAGIGNQNSIFAAAFSQLWTGTAWTAQRGNFDLGALINAIGATTTQTSADQTSWNHRGVLIFLNVSAIGTGSITLNIQGKDSVSGNYYTALASAAIVANGFSQYRVYPGLVAAANLTANDVLPRTWRVQVVANNANAASYTVGGTLIL